MKHYDEEAMMSEGSREAQERSIEAARRQFIEDLPRVDGLVDLSQLQKIGEGGTHDVYSDPLCTDFVIKVDRAALQTALEAGGPTLSSDLRQRAEAYVSRKNEGIDRLQKYFGHDHCLDERLDIERIMVPSEHGFRPVESIISVQEASDVFSDPGRVDFSTGYAEQQPDRVENSEAYDLLNSALLGRGEFDERGFLALNEKMRAVFALIENDPQFAESLRDFLSRFKTYYEETGDIIDLVGQENLLFYRSDEGWNFQLGSVLKEGSLLAVDEVLGRLREGTENNSLDAEEKEQLTRQLMNHVTLIRLVNAAAMKVGLGKLIEQRLTEEQLGQLSGIDFKELDTESK